MSLLRVMIQDFLERDSSHFLLLIKHRPYFKQTNKQKTAYHTRVLGLERDKLTERSHMWRLVRWHRWWRVQDVMVTGNERWECLVRHRELLHGTSLDQL